MSDVPPDWDSRETIRDAVSSTGGARIGRMNATWPFATLTARRDTLLLNATLLGRYSFDPTQVISIEKYTLIPVLGSGIRIHHNVPTYPKKIVFWCFTPASLIRRIKETGFLPSADPDSLPPDRGMPIRWQAAVVMIVLWNLLFLLDIGLPPKTPPKPGWFTWLAVFLLFAGSVAIWRVRWLQRCILKPDRSPSEIKAWLYLLALVGGLMSLGLLFVVLLIPR